jgi:hypothetical protein
MTRINKCFRDHLASNSNRLPPRREPTAKTTICWGLRVAEVTVVILMLQKCHGFAQPVTSCPICTKTTINSSQICLEVIYDAGLCLACYIGPLVCIQILVRTIILMPREDLTLSGLIDPIPNKTAWILSTTVSSNSWFQMLIGPLPIFQFINFINTKRPSLLRAPFPTELAPIVTSVSRLGTSRQVAYPMIRLH